MGGMTTDRIEYSANGTDMIGQFYQPAEPRGNGVVLLFSAAPGPGPHERRQAERLAAAGYRAMLCDLHGGGRALSDMQHILSRLEAMRANPDQTRETGHAALQALRRHAAHAGPVAAIGFCFGGTLALELGRSGAELAGIVGFHSGLAPLGTDAPGRISCPVHVAIGADDPTIPPQQRLAFEDEMRRAEVEWSMQLFGNVGHAFTDIDAARLGRSGFAYNPLAARQSWQAMLDFLARHLG